jgi:putative ABC transport system substrate-binding protein
MDRRRFVQVVLGGATAVPNSAQAQPARPWRIGFLGDGTASTRAGHTLEPFRDGLREVGYIEGRNVVLIVRWSEGSVERLHEIAAEFVRLNVDVIVTHGLPAGQAAKAATATIPIVIAAAADMVGAGLVASLGRPGGNVTGSSDQVTEISGKAVDLVTELLPGLQAVAVLWNRANPGALRTSDTLQSAARARRLKITPVTVARPSEFEGAIDIAAKSRVGAVLVVHDTITLTHRAAIAQFALRRGLPAISASPVFAEAGFLMSYGPNLAALFKRAAVFVDKIFNGAKPASIPVEQPTRFTMVVNLSTAKALGLTIPPSLLLRADQVIE